MDEAIFFLSGLCCANCAGKIEKRAGKLPGVDKAELNFANQKLRLSFSRSETTGEKLADAVKAIIKRIEPEVKVSEIKEGTKVSVIDGREKGGEFSKAELVSSVIGVCVYVAALLFGGADGAPRLALFLAAYAALGWRVVFAALRNLFRGELFDENFLMSVSALGAFYIGEYPEAVAVTLFYKIGEYLQSRAVGRSRKSIKSLLQLQPDYATIEEDGKLVRVDPGDVKTGDIIIVLPGEKIPLDGIVAEGGSRIDASSLTGESAPVDANPGDAVLSGAINVDGALRIKATRDYQNSTAARIMALVEDSSSRKAPVEKFITKFSKVYTPAVVLAAVLLAVAPPLFIGGAEFADWLRRALVFLVVSCPCALVISVPLSFFSGIGAASARGILIKGGNYLQALSKINAVVFDKTGTLTEGEFEVAKLEPANGTPERELLGAAYHVERYSTHPAAKAIVREYEKSGASGGIRVSDLKEIPGSGMKAVAEGKTVACGNARLMNAEGLTVPAYEGPGSVVYVAVDGKYAGLIVVTDKIKAGAESAVERLRELGIDEIITLTGDGKASAEQVARRLGINKYHAELLPHQKVDIIEKLYSENKDARIAFAGDGVNDAPILARCDVGFAMGGVGSDAAIEAADIVIVNDEPRKIAEALTIARKTMKIVRQNVAFAIFIKFAILLLSALGISSSLWLAVFADVGVCLLVVFNSMRANFYGSGQ